MNWTGKLVRWTLPFLASFSNIKLILQRVPCCVTQQKNKGVDRGLQQYRLIPDLQTKMINVRQMADSLL